MSCHTDNTGVGVAIQYGFFHDFEDDCAVWRHYHTDYIHRVSLQYAFFMHLKSMVMCKGFTTLITFIGHLSSVCSFMHLKVTVMWKSFITLISFIGFQSSMCFFMPVKMTVTCKGFNILSIYRSFLSTLTFFMPTI